MAGLSIFRSIFFLGAAIFLMGVPAHADHERDWPSSGQAYSNRHDCTHRRYVRAETPEILFALHEFIYDRLYLI